VVQLVAKGVRTGYQHADGLALQVAKGLVVDDQFDMPNFVGLLRRYALIALDHRLTGVGGLGVVIALVHLVDLPIR